MSQTPISGTAGGQPVDPAALLATPPSTAEPARLPTAGPAKKKPVLTLVLGAVVIAGLGFGGGLLTGRATAPESSSNNPGNFTMPSGASRGDFAGQGSGDGASAFPGGGDGLGSGGSGVATGTVTAADASGLTLQTEDGSAVTVTAGDDTTVTVSGTLSDVAVGDQVTVIGTEADDGSIAATSISEGSSLFGRGGGGFMPGGGSMPTGMDQPDSTE
jgi:hypothetical protein